MKELSKSNKIKVLIAPKMTDIIKFLDSNRKYAIYTGEIINGIYRYLEMIESPTTFSTSCQNFHSFGPSSFTNNYTETP